MLQPTVNFTLDPEVEKRLEDLPTAQFARAAFDVDLLAEQGPLLGEPIPSSSMGSCASCASTSSGWRSGYLLDCRG